MGSKTKAIQTVNESNRHDSVYELILSLTTHTTLKAHRRCFKTSFLYTSSFDKRICKHIFEEQCVPSLIVAFIKNIIFISPDHFFATVLSKHV